MNRRRILTVPSIALLSTLAAVSPVAAQDDSVPEGVEVLDIQGPPPGQAEVVLLTAVAAQVAPGESTWIALSWTDRFADASSFEVRASADQGVDISYPTNTVDHSSLYWDDELSISEIDYTALKLQVPENVDSAITLSIDLRYTAPATGEITKKLTVQVPVDGGTAPPTTVPPTTGSSTTVPPTTVPPTTVPSTTVAPTTVSPTTVAPGPITNVAVNGTASQVSDYKAIYGAANAVDGSRTGIKGQSHTGLTTNPWWQLELDKSYDIETIDIYNRSDCCQSRLKKVVVIVSENPISNDLDVAKTQGTVITHPGMIKRPSTLEVNASGKYVKIFIEDHQYLSLGEVEIFGR